MATTIETTAEETKIPKAQGLDPTAPGRVNIPQAAGIMERKPLTYLEMFHQLNPDRPETEEQKSAREKKEKREAIFAAIGDGISALSNLFATSQYAPNAQTSNMTGTMRARIERLKAEREANRRAYNEGYFRATMLDRQEREQNRTWLHQLERERIQDKRYEAQAARAAAEAELDRKLKEHQISGAEYDAERKRVQASYEPFKQDKELARLDSEIGRNKASAANSYASAASHSRAYQQVEHHFNGKAYPKGSNDYEKDVREAARQYNERHGKWVDTTSEDGKKERKWQYDEGFVPIETDRRHPTRGTTPRKAEEYAGEVETALAKERGDKEFDVNQYKRVGKQQNQKQQKSTGATPPPLN